MDHNVSDGGMEMVHWAWLLMAFFAGLVFGMFILALAEVSREHDDEGRDDG